MKKKINNGFTLIELLAVIVILAVIALIATPLIMNVINDSKKSAAQDSGYSIIRAGELDAAANKKIPPFYYDESSNLELKGVTPTKFILNFNEDMDSSLTAWINGYCVVKDYNVKSITINESKKSVSECINITYQKYNNGEAIYFNPELNKKCDASRAVSIPGTKNGCMKWYAFNDSESSSTVNVILDHNTTAKVAWNSSGNSKQMKEAKEALNNDTKTWDKNLKSRLIKANEVANITGNTEFDMSKLNNWFYLEDNSQNAPKLSQGQATYKWLFDYTFGCTNWGCSIADNSTQGYWTESSANSYAWFINDIGNLNNASINSSDKFGVRPVVTISKSILK